MVHYPLSLLFWAHQVNTMWSAWERTKHYNTAVLVWIPAFLNSLLIVSKKKSLWSNMKFARPRQLMLTWFNVYFGKLGGISCGNGSNAISKRNPVSCLGTAGQTSVNIMSFANIYIMDALERKKWWQCRGTVWMKAHFWIPGVLSESTSISCTPLGLQDMQTCYMDALDRKKWCQCRGTVWRHTFEFQEFFQEAQVHQYIM
jgi:hypothetical protein